MSNETELTAAISKAKDAADKGDWAAVKRHLDDAQTWLRAITTLISPRSGINVGPR